MGTGTHGEDTGTVLLCDPHPEKGTLPFVTLSRELDPGGLGVKGDAIKQ